MSTDIGNYIEVAYVKAKPPLKAASEMLMYKKSV